MLLYNFQHDKSNDPCTLTGTLPLEETQNRTNLLKAVSHNDADRVREIIEASGGAQMLLKDDVVRKYSVDKIIYNQFTIGFIYSTAQSCNIWA